tara:strand:+ start:1593 stop:1736 length:144 start_codon:yes stop_codon:yes gene_type:complete
LGSKLKLIKIPIRNWNIFSSVEALRIKKANRIYSIGLVKIGWLIGVI